MDHASSHRPLPAGEGGLVRALGPFEAITILMGSIIGSGIFLVPNSIAQQVGSFGLVLLVWIVSGLLSLFGALSYAELGSILPRAGGQYVFLRESYGKLWAFLFGWTEFWVIKAGSIAAVAVAFAKYTGYFVPLSTLTFRVGSFTLPFLDQPIPLVIPGEKTVAIICIAVLSAINYLGVRFGGWVQNVFTVSKVAAIAALVLLTFTLGHGTWENFKTVVPTNTPASALSAFGVAMVAALWAYDGWNNVTYVAGEVRDPQRNIPLALALGTFLIILIYLAANLAYAYVLPMPQIAQSELVAADAVKTFLGGIGGGLIAAAVMISTFGTVNGMILTGARVNFAMARDGVFFRRMSKVHPIFHTPSVSTLWLGLWSALLTLSGRFDQLFTYVIFAAWIFYAMTAFGVVVLRKRMPDVPRPYKTWGYPWVTFLFVGISLWFVINTLIQDPRDSLMGLILISLGLPFYAYWNRRAARAVLPMTRTVEK